MDVKGKKHDDVIAVYDEVGKSICRDFLRNVCHRGRRCKFKHPSAEELEETVDVSASGMAYEFCHDFQNGQCQRSNCRFIHCSKDEEEQYMNMKTLSLRLKYQYDFGIGDYFLGQDKNLPDISIPTEARPVCRDFLNRDCHRGKKCKFAHVDQEQIALLTAEAEAGLGLKHEGGVKRARMVVEEVGNYTDASDYCNLRSSHPSIARIPPSNRHLEEENQNLRKRIQDLEKQVSDMAATNEVLLEQNAQFRLHKRGIAAYGHSGEGLPPSSFAANPVTAVVSNAPRPMPVQLNVQVTGQPPVPDIAEFVSPTGHEMLAAGPGSAPPRAVVAQPPLHQGSVSVPQTSTIAAQVMAANIAVNSSGKVEVIPVNNQAVPALSAALPPGNPQLGQPQLNQLPPQPLASFSGPGQTPHNPMVQQPMASFAPAPHNQLATQQPVSFAGTIMAAAIGGCAMQTASVPGDILQSSVGSMGPAVVLPQPTLIYSVPRTNHNMPLASPIIPATGHEVALVTDRTRNPVSSMLGPLHVPPHAGKQGFNSVSPASQALVPPHQNNDIISVPPCAPMTSGIGGASKQMSPAVSRGVVHPVVPHAQPPRVSVAQHAMMQGASPLNDPGMITYTISAVGQPQLHNCPP